VEDEEPKTPAGHRLGDDVSRLSLDELHALKAACQAEIERIDRQIAEKGETRAAAHSLFRR
jgi:uncharacterized small protein (DUF1192 family)